MASEVSYPKLSVTNWWALRKKFQSNPNIKITPGFLAMHFDMGEDSARTNVIPPLRAIGFIDDNGIPTDLAYEWRDDNKYDHVCYIIRDSVYPKELNDAVIDPADRIKVENWFKNKARVGEASARKMAAFYLMLCEATIPGAPATVKKIPDFIQKPLVQADTRPVQSSMFTPEEEILPPLSVSSETIQGKATSIATSLPPVGGLPVQISIQIQLSPEFSPEQIDQVFASLIRNIKSMQ